MNEIEAWTENKKMVLNEKKTKCIIFNNSKNFQFTSDLKLKGEKLDIVTEAKLLGIIITNDLKWKRNTQHIVKNANCKMRMLQIASKFMSNKHDLLQIYKSFIRSRLEYGCAVWNSSLTNDNERDIERVQKAAVKLILKKEYVDYRSALTMLNIDSLKERRKKLCLKFAKNCLKNENFKKLFPIKKSSHAMKKRKTERFLIENISTEKYKKSAIPEMKRLLNYDNLKINALLNTSVTRENCLYPSL